MKKLILAVSLVLLTSCGTTPENQDTAVDYDTIISIETDASGEADQTYNLETEIPVAVKINTKNPTNIIAIELNYDSSALEILPISNENSAFSIFPKREILANQIRIIAAQPGEGVSDVAEVVRFNVVIKKPGRNEISINNTLSQVLWKDEAVPFASKNLVLQTK
jgi:hypothetical protein